MKSLKKIFINPGFVFLPKNETTLCGVVGSGVLITIYDKRKKIGGMAHYVKPGKTGSKMLTPYYAFPSIKGILKLFKKRGSNRYNLEAGIYGGASNSKHFKYVPHLHRKNVEKAINILEKSNVRVISKDVGGERGRKILFNSFTGETIVAKVNKIRKSDWYPKVC